ncbi:MAG: YkgJ family cysteine cluster protein [Bacteroidota bacterium]
MLIDGKCSIYEHRPQTCRNYDCRIFTAAGILADEAGKDLITRRIRRWKFSYPTRRDIELHRAVQATAKFLQTHATSFPTGVVPPNSTQLAILAIKVYDVFLKQREEADQTKEVSSDIEMVKAIMEANEKFEARQR